MIRLSSVSTLSPLVIRFDAPLIKLPLTDLLDRVGTGLEKFTGLFSGDDKDGEDAATAGSNSLTALADIQTPSLWNYATPGANLYHNSRDGAGNRIVNAIFPAIPPAAEDNPY